MSLLPSAPAINKHLRPGLYSVRRDKTGIETTVRQNLPVGGMAILTPLTGMFWLIRAIP